MLTVDSSNGKKFTLTLPEHTVIPEVGAVVNFQHNGFSNGLPIEPRLLGVRLGESWRDNLLNKIPYKTCKGSKRGGHIIKCRGCQRPFLDNEELRIQTRATFAPPNSAPYPGFIVAARLWGSLGKCHFCLSATCVSKALSAKSKHCFYPNFTGEVCLPQELKDELSSTILAKNLSAQLWGIEWVLV
jgi:hypothetical protein